MKERYKCKRHFYIVASHRDSTFWYKYLSEKTKCKKSKVTLYLCFAIFLILNES